MQQGCIYPPLFPVPLPPPPSKGNVQQLKAMTNPRKTCSKNCASLLLDVLDIPNENRNRDITSKGGVGALPFDIVGLATPFSCLSRSPRCENGCFYCAIDSPTPLYALGPTGLKLG